MCLNSNGAAVHRISNQTADKESGLFVLTGEPLCLLLYFIYFIHSVQGQMQVDQYHCKCASVTRGQIVKNVHCIFAKTL